MTGFDAAGTPHHGRSWLLVAVLAQAAASGCTPPDATATERARLASGPRADAVIAVAWPWEAGYGLRFGDGVDLAAAEINAAGGVRGRQITLRRVDDHGTIDAGQLAAQRIASDPGIVAVIGHLHSYISLPAAAIYEKAGLVMLSPASTDPELTEHGYTRVFRGTFTHTTVGQQMAAYASDRGFKRLALYYVRDAYGRGLANAFEAEANRRGLTVVDRQSYDASDSVSAQTFERSVTTSDALGIDAIFLAGKVPAAAEFIVAARKHGIRVPILGGDAMSSASLVQVAGAAAEGTVVASMFHPDEPRPAVRQFTTRFQQRYGALPDAAAALGYDAVYVLADAMRRAGSFTPDSVAHALHAGPPWKGVSATFAFDAAGNLQQKEVVRLVVRDGQFVYLGERALAQRTAP